MSDAKIICSITETEIDMNKLLEQITFPTTGAAVIFSGIIRGETAREGRTTTHLLYEAYIPMAEAKMKQVAKEIQDRWPVLEGILIVQRIGELKPGTPTVMIACTASHRDCGIFDAAHYGIDRLKEIVPVWKKEFGPSGEEWIEGHYLPKAGE
jgi:molybdopterin synthase catalytic subunit